MNVKVNMANTFNIMTLQLGLLALLWLSQSTVFAQPSSFLLHRGMCDASAAVALDKNHFVVANDEDNVLRIYRNDRGGLPLYRLDLGAFLLVDPKFPESDIEGATWLGERIFWITSHGRNKNAEARESRHRLFATRVLNQSGRFQLVPEGVPYRHLQRDLLNDSRMASYQIGRASRLAPKAFGGMNIEGVAALPSGHLLIGFRNPIPGGKALLVPLLNPLEVLKGQACRFGEPLRFDMKERGVRDLMPWRAGCLILAGDYDKGKKTRLYFWKGSGTEVTRIRGDLFGMLNPEGIVSYPGEENRVHILSDDGTLNIHGDDCKQLPDETLKQFRSAWFPLPKDL